MSFPHAHSFSLSLLLLLLLQGRYCSRCLYGSGCSGCVISNGATPTELKPGDHIAVTVEKGEVCVEGMCEEVESHSSLGTKRKDHLSLEECLSAFSQRYMCMYMYILHAPCL